MHCFKLILCLALSIKVCLAETTIITKRKNPHHQALLDKKFLIMQEDISRIAQPLNDSRGLNSMNKILVKATIPKAMTIKTKPIPSKAESPLEKDQSTWDDYAQEVELDESLSVGAKLLNY